ncbi:MAG: MlaD family protein, partial [Bdellovibrionota bacterium]
MYRVDAVFDTARGLLPGARVKIAGANVGVVDDIVLTPQRKALVEMRIDKRFAPFHTDAYCSSRPQGLVGVEDVNCQPGTPSGTPLADGQEG